MEIDLQEAIYLHKAGQLNEAEALYRKIIEEHPDAAQPHYLLGVILMAHKTYQDAAPFLEKACNLNKDNHAYHCAYGETLAQLRKYDQAEEALTHVITQDFQHLEALTNLADVLMRKEEYQRAKDTAQLILDQHPLNQPALAIAEGAQPRKFLNVGGASKLIPVPRHYDGWEHHLLDIDPNQHPDILCDARELETHEGNLYDAIYCSHNLEHYYRHDVFKVLRGFLHVLKDDGFVEIKVPDLNLLMRHVVQHGLDIDDVVYNSGMGPITVRDILYGHNKQVENSGVDFYAHKTGFSAQTLGQVLLNSGFKFVHYERHASNFEARALAFKKEPSRLQEYLLKVNMAHYDRGISEEEIVQRAKEAKEKKEATLASRVLLEYGHRYPLEKTALGYLCDGLKLHWRFDQRQVEAIEKLEHRVDQTFEVVKTYNDPTFQLKMFLLEERGFKQLDKLRNKHKGQRGVIMGNGPSLNKMDMSFLKDEIVIAMNRIYLGFEKFDFLPTYYLCQDPAQSEIFNKEILENVPAHIPKFVNSQRWTDWPTDREDIIFWMTRISFDSNFSRDATLGCFRGGTSDAIALQLAYHLGFDEVVLIGCDHTYDKDGAKPGEQGHHTGGSNYHFTNTYTHTGLPHCGNGYVTVLPCLQAAEKIFLEAGRKVIDATVEGQCPAFPKVDYREVFNVAK